MTNKQLIKEAKEKTKGKYGTLYLVDTLISAASIIANIFPVLGCAVINGPLSVGEIKLYDDVIKGNKPNERDTIKPFKTQFGSSFYLWVKQFLYILIPLIVMVVCTTLGGGILSSILLAIRINYKVKKVINIFLIVLIIITIIIFIIYLIKRICLVSIGQYVLYREPELDGDEAMKKGIALMNGHTFQLIKLDFSLLKYIILTIFLNITAPIIKYCRIRFFEMIYEGQIEKEIHEEMISKIIQEENEKRKASLDKKEEELDKQKEENKKQQEDVERKLIELEKQRKEQEIKNEKSYQDVLNLIETATTSNEYKFINNILSNLGDYKDAKKLLEKYSKIEVEIKIQEDLLNG